MRAVPATQEEWSALTLSDFRGRGAWRINRSSVFFPGYENAMQTCGGLLDADTCRNLAHAEEILSDFLEEMSLEISCYREVTIERLLEDRGFDVPEGDLFLRMNLGAVDDRIEFSVDLNGWHISIHSIGFIDYIAGRGRFSHGGVNHVEELFGGACRVSLAWGNGLVHEKLQKAYQSIEKAIQLQGAMCVDLSLARTVSTPLFSLSYASLGNRPLDEGEFWGLLPLFNAGGASDDVYCQ